MAAVVDARGDGAGGGGLRSNPRCGRCVLYGHEPARRAIRTVIKHECLNHIIPFGERHLRRAIAEFVDLCLANIAFGKNHLTLAQWLDILRAMRRVVRTVAAIRFALAMRRDVLLEILALRHHLAVLVRSNGRFRASDRLLWLILRRVWPQWRVALMLVKPATVDRWHRDGSLGGGAVARDVLADPASRPNAEL